MPKGEIFTLSWSLL